MLRQEQLLAGGQLRQETLLWAGWGQKPASPALAAEDDVSLFFRTDATGLVGALAQFAHLTADAIVSGSATSHTAPTDHADSE